MPRVGRDEPLELGLSQRRCRTAGRSGAVLVKARAPAGHREQRERRRDQAVQTDAGANRIGIAADRCAARMRCVAKERDAYAS